MKHPHSSNRRQFLKLSTGLAALGMTGLGLGAARSAQAASPSDYKALVCVYLYGGNDGHNLIVPLDTARYTAYQNVRAGLALGAAKLCTPIADSGGNPYALHYGLPEMNTLFGQGKLAVLLNTGMLERPLTRAQYLQGIYAPTNLFSHSDQTVQVQSGQPTVVGTGWGGRLLDRFGAAQDSLAAVSVAGPSLLLQGQDVAGNVVTPGVDPGLSGMGPWPASAAAARRQALTNILQMNGGNVLRQAANQSMTDGLHLADALKTNSGGTLSHTFPGTELGRQLEAVARLIRLRSQTPGRQVFFCGFGGFDTHSGQDWQQWDLLKQLSQALNVFYQEIGDAGLGAQVTAFTQSEFGRTLQPNGGGSDHGWGSHHLVLGGAVQGGIYGQMPSHALNGPDDANGRGVLIPKISTSQVGATLGRWFGASDAELAAVFPNLSQFPNSNLGFMG
ncbi:MAG: DUF1501 domain-containing protein [Candidatus Methylumidiphilus sp.]